MIKPGLKIGDVFEDGGLYYEVQSVIRNGYISKRVEKPVEKKTSRKKKTEEVEGE
jgi:hypothetical protein